MVAGFRTGGRQRGAPNRLTSGVKEAILAALEQAGGGKSLANVARENPQVFCMLLAKLLPHEISGADGGPLQFQSMISVAAASLEAKLERINVRDDVIDGDVCLPVPSSSNG